MKKIAKFPIYLAMLATSLTSCGAKSMAGVYGFQMGKEKGTHFGIYLTLTDNYTVIESEPTVVDKYKSCEFAFSLKTGDESSQSIESLLKTLADLLGQSGDRLSIPGYYYMSGKTSGKGGEEMKLGVDFSFLKKIWEDIGIKPITFPELGPDVIEKVVYTTYTTNMVNMYVPCGEVDLLYQLYWYGIDFNYNATDGITHNPSPYGVHEPGTHPTADDVKAINETYNYKAAHQEMSDYFDMDLEEYRNYYTLNLGLTKN